MGTGSQSGEGRRRVRVLDDASLEIFGEVVAAQLHFSASTSGGPGGQHANRARTRVVVRLDLEGLEVAPGVRARLLERFGPQLRSSASRFRSQSQNRAAALDQLAARLEDALSERAPRRATKPTTASRQRRLDDKRSRARLKELRRSTDD